MIDMHEYTNEEDQQMVEGENMVSALSKVGSIATNGNKLKQVNSIVNLKSSMIHGEPTKDRIAIITDSIRAK